MQFTEECTWRNIVFIEKLTIANLQAPQTNEDLPRLWYE